MPAIIECAELTGELQKKCFSYFEPIYNRNFPAVIECVKKEKDGLACMTIYSATCHSDPPPPAGVKPRPDINKEMYNKYILPRCPKAPPIRNSQFNNFLPNALELVKKYFG